MSKQPKAKKSKTSVKVLPPQPDTWEAFVSVTDYDEDFCLFCEGKRIPENSRSKKFTSGSKIEALVKLLESLDATDYRAKYAFFGALPKGYTHAKRARHAIRESLNLAKRGVVLPPVWGGNHDVEVVVRKSEEVPKAGHTQGVCANGYLTDVTPQYNELRFRLEALENAFNRLLRILHGARV